MIALSGLRPAVVVSQVVLTFGAAQVAGAFAAAHYQQDQVNTAQQAIGRADQAFDSRAAQVLADGTPHASVDPVLAMHKRLQAQAVPTSNFFIDRLRIDALQKRAADTESLTRQVAATETQVEVSLHQQLLASIKKLRDQVDAARAAGLDPGDYGAFADTTEKANSQLAIPRLAQTVIDQVTAKGQALAGVTADKVAADQAAAQAAETARQAALALENARNGAQGAQQTAQAALARAQTIPVLKVADNQAAIAALGQTLTQALAANAPIDQFRTLSQGFRDQSAALNNLVDTRQSAYDLLDLTRREIDAAQNAKNDVSAYRAQLDPLGPQLDGAGDLGSIANIRGQVQAIKNAVDAKYLAAQYGVGRVIVVSTDQERLVALQDGVVVLNTLATTGRPSLPTVTGTFHIFFKSSPYHMCTPPQWRGTQYDYGCVDEQWAMEFESSGYFIHDAYWRHQFGPGTDTQSGGTHGCVNLPNGSMQWLYNWAPIGTTVITKLGDIPS
ncbi:MAG: L,D-transpeptidase [Candidatus Dormibacteria bacterium]